MPSLLQRRRNQLINFYQIDTGVVLARPSTESRPRVVNARTLFSQERFNYETRRRRNRISMVTWCRRNCRHSSGDQHRLSELRAVPPAPICLGPRSPSHEMQRAVSEVATTPLIYRRSRIRTARRTDGRTDGLTGVEGSSTTGEDLLGLFSGQIET